MHMLAVASSSRTHSGSALCYGQWGWWVWVKLALVTMVTEVESRPKGISMTDSVDWLELCLLRCSTKAWAWRLLKQAC